MLKRAAAVVALLSFVGSAFGQMTLLGDERYNEYRIRAVDSSLDDGADGHESTLIGQPFVSSLSDSANSLESSGQAFVDQDSFVTGDLISADLSATAVADSFLFGGSDGVSLARSRVNVVFSLAQPTPYDFAVTSWTESGIFDIGEATARLEWADGSGVIEDLVGVGSASGVLAAGEYRLVFDAVASAVAVSNISGFDHKSAALIATFSVPATPTACSEADVTTQGAGLGDPLFGIPDGVITGADIQYFVNQWFAGCP